MVKRIRYLFVLIILVTLIYSNHFHNDFQFDDYVAIQTNIYIKNLSNIPGFFTDSSSYAYLHRYRPVALASFALDYHFANGLNPFYFHLHMFFWFLVQLVLMFFLFSKILKQAFQHAWTDLFAIIAIAWYGLHTANAETINYISARYDSFSTLSVIASLYLFIQFPQKRKYLIYLIPASIGMLIKEQTVMFAPILFIYVLLFELHKGISHLFKRGGLNTLRYVIKSTFPAFLVMGILSVLVLFMQTKTYSPVGISVYHYAITQPWVILRYFIIFFIPVKLSPDTDWQAFSSIFDERVIVGLIFLISLFFIIYKTSESEKTRPVSFGIVWFLLALMPTSSFIPIPEVTNDHRMFFPFVGLSLSITYAIGLFIITNKKIIAQKTSFKILITVAILLVLGLNSYGVWKRNIVWKTNESLWYDVTIKSPKNGRGLMNYGVIQMGKGNLGIALEYFEKALVYWPYYPYLHINLGIIHNALSGPEKAEPFFKNAIEYGPVVNVTYYYYAEFLMSYERILESIYYAEYSLSLDKSHLQTRHLLMNLYQRLGESDKLENIVNETLKIFPNDPLTQSFSIQKNNEEKDV